MKLITYHIVFQSCLLFFFNNMKHVTEQNGA